MNVVVLIAFIIGVTTEVTNASALLILLAMGRIGQDGSIVMALSGGVCLIIKLGGRRMAMSW